MKRLNPEYIKQVMESVNQSPYFRLISMRLVHFELGSSITHVEVNEQHLQPFGVVHGGVFASLIDAAAFWAVYPEIPEESAMTSVDLKLNYLAPATTGLLIAHGKRIKIGRTLGLGEAQILDTSGRILAHGISTLMVTKKVEFKTREKLPRKFS